MKVKEYLIVRLGESRLNSWIEYPDRVPMNTYKDLNLSVNNTLTVLNKLGEDGWILAFGNPRNDFFFYRDV